MSVGYSASNQQTDETQQTANSKTASAASGGSRGIASYIAFPGSSIATDAGGNGAGVPWWVWPAVAGAGVGIWFLYRRGRK